MVTSLNPLKTISILRRHRHRLWANLPKLAIHPRNQDVWILMGQVPNGQFTSVLILANAVNIPESMMAAWLDQYPTVPASTTGIHRVLDTTHGGLRFRVRKSRPFADRDRLQAEGVLSGSRKSTWYKRPFTLFDYGQLPDMSDSGVSLSLTSSASLASLVRQSAYGANHTGVQGGGQQGGAGNAVNGVGHGGNRGETAEGTGEMGLGTRETARGTGEMALGTGETVEGRADRVGKVGTDQDDGGCL